MKNKYFEVKANFEIALNKRFAIPKTTMKKVTKSILWDIFKHHKNNECNIVVEDTTGKRFWFCVSSNFGYSDIYISCCLTDDEISNMGLFNGNCNGIEYTTSYYIDYMNGQHRELDYSYASYEFNRY